MGSHALLPPAALRGASLPANSTPLFLLSKSTEAPPRLTQENSLKWLWKVSAVDAARTSKQQVVELEHLINALMEQNDGLAWNSQVYVYFPRLEFTIVSAARYIQFISKQPKVEGGTSGPMRGSSFTSLLDTAKKHKKILNDEFLSVEHFN